MRANGWDFRSSALKIQDSALLASSLVAYSAHAVARAWQELKEFRDKNRFGFWFHRALGKSPHPRALESVRQSLPSSPNRACMWDVPSRGSGPASRLEAGIYGFRAQAVRPTVEG